MSYFLLAQNMLAIDDHFVKNTSNYKLLEDDEFQLL
jgi:hypothetical protein